MAHRHFERDNGYVLVEISGGLMSVSSPASSCLNWPALQPKWFNHLSSGSSADRHTRRVSPRHLCRRTLDPAALFQHREVDGSADWHAGRAYYMFHGFCTVGRLTPPHCFSIEKEVAHTPLSPWHPIQGLQIDRNVLAEREHHTLTTTCNTVSLGFGHHPCEETSLTSPPTWLPPDPASHIYLTLNSAV